MKAINDRLFANEHNEQMFDIYYGKSKIRVQSLKYNIHSLFL